ncbi:hypothetical protein MWN34_15765 [Ancylobacter sp. 6x-1]|uniref:Uncharacterized protein n=1 Tax=Ancylobacter crimeensis TaxID=2579147 RepID=A0ABT0DEH2_9HYPH|nr:hypothetical protein [Ancylobacter crimeensis]MCK0198370.1 hypothetical protein [Ancylobacter crimeensis]
MVSAFRRAQTPENTGRAGTTALAAAEGLHDDVSSSSGVSAGGGMGNNLDPDYIAGRDGYTHFVPTDREAYQRGVDEREGRAGRSMNWGSGGAGFPIVMLAFIPILIGIGFVVAVPIFPVAGIITAVIAYGVSLYLGVDLYTDQGLNNLAISVLICIPLYLVALFPESRAARYPAYRAARHWVRVVGLAIALNEVLLPTLAVYLPGGDERVYAAWGIVAGGFTLEKLAWLVALMVAVHLFFRWWVTRGMAMSPDRRFGWRQPV